MSKEVIVNIRIQVDVKSNLSKEENKKLSAQLKNGISEYADLQASVMFDNKFTVGVNTLDLNIE